jgi:hypothetical protein
MSARGGILKITAKFSVVMAAIFAVICYSVAISGFSSLGDIADPVQQADAKGFAWFWVFLGTVAVVFGGVGIWLVRTHRDEE